MFDAVEVKVISHDTIFCEPKQDHDNLKEKA